MGRDRKGGLEGGGRVEVGVLYHTGEVKRPDRYQSNADMEA